MAGCAGYECLREAALLASHMSGFARWAGDASDFLLGGPILLFLPERALQVAVRRALVVGSGVVLALAFPHATGGAIGIHFGGTGIKLLAGRARGHRIQLAGGGAIGVGVERARFAVPQSESTVAEVDTTSFSAGPHSAFNAHSSMSVWSLKVLPTSHGLALVAALSDVEAYARLALHHQRLGSAP